MAPTPNNPNDPRHTSNQAQQLRQFQRSIQLNNIEQARLAREREDFEARQLQEAKDALKERIKKAASLNPPPRRGEEKSIYGAIEHTTSWDQECIAWWGLFTLMKFPLNVALSYITYMQHQGLFENAGSNAYKPDEHGVFPPLYELGFDGKPVISEETRITEDQKKIYFESSKFDSDVAYLLLANGYVPPPSMATALKKTVVEFMEETWGASKVQENFPELVAQVYNRIDDGQGASSRHSNDMSETDQAAANSFVNGRRPGPAPATSGSPGGPRQ